MMLGGSPTRVAALPIFDSIAPGHEIRCRIEAKHSSDQDRQRGKNDDRGYVVEKHGKHAGP